jgi:hypothetical protein
VRNWLLRHAPRSVERKGLDEIYGLNF